MAYEDYGSFQTPKEKWIANLKSRGVMAAHPNDGWVDRESNKLIMCYPWFNNGAWIGDVVALGRPSDSIGETEYITLISVKSSPPYYWGMKIWKFERIAGCCF